MAILEKEISRRGFMKALGYGVGSLAIVGAVPAAAESVLPSGLVLAKAIPTDKNKLKYSGNGVITSFDIGVDKNIQEIELWGGYKEYIPGLMSWRLEIEGVGGLYRENETKDGIVITMQDGQKWLVSL